MLPKMMQLGQEIASSVSQTMVDCKQVRALVVLEGATVDGGTQCFVETKCFRDFNEKAAKRQESSKSV